MMTSSQRDLSAGWLAGRRTVLWIAGAAIGGLLLGLLIAFVWHGPRTTRLRDTAAYASRALPAARLESTLAAAVIEAQNDRFELARQRASDFFTGFQRRLAPTLAANHESASRHLLGRRDAIITALARSDASSASVLSETLTRYRELIRQAGLDSVVAPAPAR